MTVSFRQKWLRIPPSLEFASWLEQKGEREMIVVATRLCLNWKTMEECGQATWSDALSGSCVARCDMGQGEGLLFGNKEK